jgi:hypothetical protein
MKNLIKHIKNHNWREILNYNITLNTGELSKTIEFLHSLNIDKDILKSSGSKLTGQKRTDFYNNRALVDSALNFAVITCVRSYEDIVNIRKKSEHRFIDSCLFNTRLGYEPLVEYFKSFPPTYLNKLLKEKLKDRFANIDFKIIWKYNENGWLDFDEASFVRSLFTVIMFDRSTEEDADFLIQHREALEKVFLQFYKYEIPVLDISKWKARDGFVCKKVFEYWTEVFEILLEKGIIFDRSIVTHLLDSLLNNWKKPHLDWHVRLAGLLNVNDDEYLSHQSILFSILNTGNTNLINFSVKIIHSIYKHQQFDENGFIDSIYVIFSREKCEKSILISLDIIEFVLSKPVYKNIDVADRLSILLMQTDSKIQEKASSLLVKFLKKEDLKEIVSPYLQNLKQKAKDVLGIDNPVPVIENAIPKENNGYKEVIIPASWDDLLFHIGICIKTRSVPDIESFIEGLNRLQDTIPNDYVKQLKPYSRQLFGKFHDNYIMIYFSEFMYSWVNNNTIKETKNGDLTIPFLKHKFIRLHKKMKSNDKLPFLSTPTHEPFYIHSKSLLERILQYEECKKDIVLEDLIVAVNRMLPSSADEETVKLSMKLKGGYADAIRYYFGISDKIDPFMEYLPLWTQIARIKNPDGIFQEFNKTSAGDYPSVCGPFQIDFKIEEDKTEYGTWHRLVLDSNWNRSWYNKEKSKVYPDIFYNTASFNPADREDIAFQFSLTPLYPDPLLCRYVPYTSAGNEVREFENCMYPLQFIINNKLKIYHSGWIYIAVCLIFEKKISRDLSAEYIRYSLINRNEDLTYLAVIIGRLISGKFAPVNRLIEYFDRPDSSLQIKRFQLLIIEKCIEHLDYNNLPVNTKKIISYYYEWSNSLNIKNNPAILSKIKALKL